MFLMYLYVTSCEEIKLGVESLKESLRYYKNSSPEAESRL